ncbi:hypothetical protein BCV69DRAFT_221607 [Microstroma glucosiphilum]|uniref:Uncharacterized protein n=1 Tax=Pseudomicrostroma glucosiphilum TaxID=1684307 RepID=A0A316U5N8_9BASI|nr:hypothetical protein BCV69DRAFT_221607 [Pseudomicrostroma glucosiphilum]PWN20154.1 hypothetical protein BCV69DRAFT_221607 [Pseudomicrostroma glucosiphilum]
MPHFDAGAVTSRRIEQRPTHSPLSFRGQSYTAFRRVQCPRLLWSSPRPLSCASVSSFVSRLPAVVPVPRLCLASHLLPVLSVARLLSLVPHACSSSLVPCPASPAADSVSQCPFGFIPDQGVRHDSMRSVFAPDLRRGCLLLWSVEAKAAAASRGGPKWC